jgi:hypothetical protein
MIRLGVITLSLAALLAAPAAAEQIDVTAQAKAARAEFLLSAASPNPAATICMVDTGVNVNPDTSGVIARLAVSGEATDLSATLHGTQMAMFMGAARNGFGMVGLWPAARMVSVRANLPGQDAFSTAGYINGIRTCGDATMAYGVKVVVLPSSSPLPFAPAEEAALRDEILGLRATGINVVAAAGNSGGMSVGLPGTIPGVIAVGASDTVTGAACGFSAAGTTLSAPGCTLDGADPVSGTPLTAQQGTSESSVLVATALAALRTWRPDLGPDEAERLLAATAHPVLDLTAAFGAAGLASVAPPVPATAISTPIPSPQPSPQPTATPQRRLAKPSVIARLSGSGPKRTLTVRAANRPRGARLTVRVYARGSHGKLRRVASQTQQSATVRLRVRGWRRVTAAFSDPSGLLLASPTRTVTRR